MNKIENLLIGLGLPVNAAKIYLALLDLKKGKVVDLANKTGVLRPAIYENLNKLKNLGLIAETVDGRKRFWLAEHPKRLIQLLRLKQDNLSQVLPALIKDFENDKYQPKIKYYFGVDGVKTLNQEALESEEKIIRSFGSLEILISILSRNKLKTFWAQRVRMKIQVRMIDDLQNKILYMHDEDFAEVKNIKYLREVRLAPAGFKFEMFIMTFDDKVLFFAPKAEEYSFSFQSPAFAETMKSWHDSLWELSEPLYPRYSG